MILRRLAAMDPGRRRTAVRAAVLLALAAFGLRVARLESVSRALARVARLWSPSDPRWIPWAVAAAGRRLPGARSCLPQALAARALLESSGRPARLRLGVSREGPFRAHAWVESGGRVVVGGDVADFAPLL